MYDINVYGVYNRHVIEYSTPLRWIPPANAEDPVILDDAPTPAIQNTDSGGGTATSIPTDLPFTFEDVSGAEEEQDPSSKEEKPNNATGTLRDKGTKAEKPKK